MKRSNRRKRNDGRKRSIASAGMACVLMMLSLYPARTGFAEIAGTEAESFTDGQFPSDLSFGECESTQENPASGEKIPERSSQTGEVLEPGMVELDVFPTEIFAEVEDAFIEERLGKEDPPENGTGEIWTEEEDLSEDKSIEESSGKEDLPENESEEESSAEEILTENETIEEYEIDNITEWHQAAQITGLRADSAVDGTRLSWEKTEGADGYLILRLQSGEAAWQIGYTASAEYLDEGSFTDRYSFYWVIPYRKTEDGIQTGLLSGYVYGKKLLDRTEHLTALSRHEGVRLNWTEVAGADSYVVKVRRNGGGMETLADVAGLTYLDAGAPEGTYSFYWVFACKKNGDAVYPGLAGDYAYGCRLASDWLDYPGTPVPDCSRARAEHDSNQTQLTVLYEQISAGKTRACINITTQGGQPILSEDAYTASVIDVFNCPEEWQLSQTGGVKVRGNSTAQQGDEKPYRIKFEKKQAMLGLHMGTKYKSWVLLRSFWNLVPDYMAFNLACTIFEGKYYSSDCCFVNLYINGVSKGIYLLCEQNQAGSGRAEVHEAEKGDAALEIGYFIEMDNYASDEDPYFSMNYMGLPVADITGAVRVPMVQNYSIKSDVNTREQVDFVKQYMDHAYSVLYEAAVNNRGEGGKTPEESVRSVIDVDSLANMLILEELTHNYDVGAGSFYMAVDFSEGSKYPCLTFFAPWDFNWAYGGSPNEGYYAATFQDTQLGTDRSNIWFVTAMRADWFRRLVIRKWQALSGSGALTDTVNHVAAEVESLRNDLGDQAGKIYGAQTLVEFVRGRIRYLDTVWR